ncbi:MAG: ligase-associated DNA damage response DEXH box helicase [Chitinophagaceae bacterium]|nr:ligase-associated DNA damage response DEXH box helicase [Chitinophagaceae bacterium]
MTKYLHQSPGFLVIKEWLQQKGHQPFAFQESAWEAIINQRSGLVNAPTGCGKTFSVFLGAVIEFINSHPKDYRTTKNNGLQLLWITPLRALAKDIGRAMEEVIAELDLMWKVGIRNGDTTTADRQKQKRQMPEVLIITPESLHLLLATKGYPQLFQTLKIIAVDEWHELLGSKRGVQIELAISRILGSQTSIINHDDSTDLSFFTHNSNLSNQHIATVWGISATIGNLDQAKDVLLSPIKNSHEAIIIKANISKKIEVESIFPDEIEKFPWSGHLGIKLAHKLIPIIEASKTTLIFINTRGMSEMWYQTLLTFAPQLSGAIALHHGSIEQQLRFWVEEALHEGKLKAVVCTASLDLGVDFRPVETIVQVGSPKGVARFLQRAGRSGHQPGAVSKIYFLPTHSLELVEAAALKQAIAENNIESREPMLLCFDVLIQFLCTLAISEGFIPDKLLKEVQSTYCFSSITVEEWLQVLNFITSGGEALQEYDEYKKVEIDEYGLYRINSRKLAMRHRMHIGTIVSDAMLKVKFMSGGFVGVIEEWFISKLTPGEVFTLAGRNLELVGIKDMTAIVKKSNSKKSIVPSWMGGRMPLTANLGNMLRHQLNKAFEYSHLNNEIQKLFPLLEMQRQLSHVPKASELLIEHIETKDGFHLFVHTFEGRLVNEAMGAILAYRISKIMPISFTFAMNDYSFELLSDQAIPVDDSNVYELFSSENLFEDIQRSVNSTEMAKRKFRDIAVIGGLIFQGYPGEHKKSKHLQASSSLLFSVFNEYETQNLLLRQAYQEVFDQQMEEVRLRNMLNRIQESNIIITFPTQLTPFSFPVKVDSIRETLSSEKLEDRVRKMIIIN